MTESGATPLRRLHNVLRRLRLYWSMFCYGWSHNRDFAHENFAFFREMRDYLIPYVGNLAGLRVLDVGCGKTMWLALLLRSCGARVTGIDTELAAPGMSLGKYWGIFRTSGFERALRSAFWDVIYARPYYRELERICRFPILFDGIDVRQMNVTDLDFADGTFDLVVSHEVFEHLPDVTGALDAIKRVMNPAAVTYIYIHNFTSISGGHHIAWKYPDTEPSTIVPPWDHLRENLAPDIPSWINGWREHQYREYFDRHFEILDWIHTVREGESLLTSETRQELSEYSEEELLTKGFIAVARPLQESRPRETSS